MKSKQINLSGENNGPQGSITDYKPAEPVSHFG